MLKFEEGNTIYKCAELFMLKNVDENKKKKTVFLCYMLTEQNIDPIELDNSY